MTVARAITVGLLLPKPFLSRKPRLDAAFESRNQQHEQDRCAAYDGGVFRCAIGATIGVRWPARQWKMAISPDSQWLATGDSDGTVRIGKRLRARPGPLMRVGGLIWCGDIQVGQDEAVSVNRTGSRPSVQAASAAR